ncbi:hypothetical protein [Arvimicrobium flavum]|uniref:hypothetical protein n=1 Tax=Arvimicrobium flavum TaxID=3393320 RepID=UPI00237BC162|nr:hypothetical protein [Mesorhizobium shangrilense]
MRFVFLLVLLSGAAVGVGYPWYVHNFSGDLIGTWRAYDRASGFRSFDAPLAEADAPVRVLVDLTALGTPTFEQDRTVLTITAATGGRTVIADTLSFHNSASPREVSPQTSDKIFRAEAGLIDPVAPGIYTFTLGPGDADAINMRSVDVVLRSDAAMLDPRAQPLGFALMAVGFIGLVAASRRRRGGPPQNPNSQPPPPRWGRNAGDR